MVLSNAERQRHHRERLKARAAGTSRGACLTPEQIADRNSVASEPLHPVPRDTSQIPTFMGWNRYEWASAPDALVEHFDLSEAVNGWRAERAEIDAQIRALSQKVATRADAIVEECGERAHEIMREHGRLGLIRAHGKDPTLG